MNTFNQQYRAAADQAFDDGDTPSNELAMMIEAELDAGRKVEFDDDTSTLWSEIGEQNVAKFVKRGMVIHVRDTDETDQPAWELLRDSDFSEDRQPQNAEAEFVADIIKAGGSLSLEHRELDDPAKLAVATNNHRLLLTAQAIASYRPAEAA